MSASELVIEHQGEVHSDPCSRFSTSAAMHSAPVIKLELNSKNSLLLPGFDMLGTASAPSLRSREAKLHNPLRLSIPDAVKNPTFKEFLTGNAVQGKNFSFVSLFSGAGIGDYGLAIAGGRCLAACEIDPHRRTVHRANLQAPIFDDLVCDSSKLVESLGGKDLDLVIATPPCQSFSTANATRGRRHDHAHAEKDSRNHLFFHALTAITKLKPRFVVFENVPNFLEKRIAHPSSVEVVGRVIDFIDSALYNYISWHGVRCFSQLGLPQRRKRALALYVRKDVAEQLNLSRESLDPSAWPGNLRYKPTHICQALQRGLAASREKLTKSSPDNLHSWPAYSSLHMKWISGIPKGSGLSAWSNACENCGDNNTTRGEIRCISCGKNILSRPHIVLDDGSIRAIRGFKTSYRRMNASEIAPTITTASGHFSSDLKLHPTEDRVLSARECAVLQTIPASFAWPDIPRQKKSYLFREMIGEAVPCLITYRLGLAVAGWANRARVSAY